MMKNGLILGVILLSLHTVYAEPPAAPALVVVDHVRFYPAPKHADAMVGGKFSGSNISPTEGFHVLAQISAEPKSDAWTELHFENKTPYRWVRYEAPAGSHGYVADVEFYAGAKKLAGQGFGSKDSPGGRWRGAVDGNTTTLFYSDVADNQYAGLDLGEQASTAKPAFSPAVKGDGPQTVTIRSTTPGAVIRYTLDGTVPGAGEGSVYTEPIKVDKTTTFVAIAQKEGMAPSPAAWTTYQVGPPVVINSFHIGNSLTGNAARFPIFAKTAGIDSQFRAFLMGGAYTVKLWNAKNDIPVEVAEWNRIYGGVHHPLDLLTVQPRDFNIDEEVENELKFFNLIREKSPDVQPWLYAEWVESNRARPSDQGKSPSYQMTKLYPAMTWEESMSAMLLYVEEVQHRVNALDKTGKRARILPCSLALGWARNLVDNNQLPGIAPGMPSFYATFFEDHVHVNPSGCYLVDLIWYAAFMHQSPEGKLLPIGTTLTSEQAKILQRLAWEIVKNYPDCGLYEEGSAPAAVPQFSQMASTKAGPAAIHLTSATPGVFFRYTLDGTPPTRTRGYVYCGVITAHPGMTLKAVAYKSGMTDSPVAEMSDSEKK